MAKRAAASIHAGTPPSPLAEVATKIEEDYRSLERIMERLAVEPSRLKDVVVGLAGALGRLKLNGRIARRSPLSNVIELETLVVGITGKQALWESLRLVPSVPAGELDSLIERAQEQKRIVETCRRQAVARMIAARDDV